MRQGRLRRMPHSRCRPLPRARLDFGTFLNGRRQRALTGATTLVDRRSEREALDDLIADVLAGRSRVTILR